MSLGLLLVAAHAAIADSAAGCVALDKATFASTKVTAAAVMPSSAYTVMAGVTVKLPEYCQVTATSAPSADSDIQIVIWMPMSGWNGKFLGVGNGGFAGSVDLADMALALSEGYATASTDTGHEANSLDASWALGHPEKVIDFGYRAIHEMTYAAQLAVEKFYGVGAKHSYFSSCSDGGREALMEAQRYPADYEGILAGDPANNWAHLMTNALQQETNLDVVPGSYISASKLPAISAAVLASCNQGHAFAYLDNPSTCKFNPETLLCKGAETNACLTKPEITALQSLYAGTKTSGGALVFPGLAPGGELGSGGWAEWITGPTPNQEPVGAIYAVSYFTDMVYDNADWNPLTFTLSAGLTEAVDKTGEALDATNPDLADFVGRGGKLILYQGWNDPAVSPYSTIDYYNSVVAKMGSAEAEKSVRLFMVPGMQHCLGGPGPTNFGAAGPDAVEPSPKAAETNIYEALEEWVQDGVAPAQVITSGPVMEGSKQVTITRPLCPYPQVAKYSGKGSQTEAASFTCAAE
jgi:feruloyl esterase